jgi:hypothetical protein
MVSTTTSSIFLPVDLPNDSKPVVSVVTNNDPSSSSARIRDDPITTKNIANERNATNSQCDECIVSNLALDELSHLAKRTKRQQNARRTRLPSLREKCSVVNFVRLRIEKFNGNNTDPKL